jgi:hypothetical protein
VNIKKEDVMNQQQFRAGSKNARGTIGPSGRQLGVGLALAAVVAISVALYVSVPSAVSSPVANSASNAVAQSVPDAAAQGVMHSLRAHASGLSIQPQVVPDAATQGVMD